MADLQDPVQTDPGILAGQMQPAPQVTGTSYTPTNMDAATGTATGYTGAQTGATTGTSQGYNATTAGLTNWDVSDNQTVQGQLKGILASDSPLMQQAQTRALQQQNARGLLNSSMAVGAGQSALYDAAMPIANADAATYGNAARTNAAQANQTAQYNAGAMNQASAFTANAANVQTQANMDAENRAALSNQASTNQANQFSAGATNQQTLANQSAQQQANSTNAAAANSAAQWAAQTGFNAQMANQDAAVKQSLTEYDAAAKIVMQNADSATRVQLQQIDAQTRTAIEEMDAKYKNQLQANASMGDLYKQMINSFTSIMQDKDMDAAGKQTAIANLTQLYNNNMQMQEQLTGLDLGQLIDPNTFGVTAGGNSGQVNTGPISGGGNGSPAPQLGGETGAGP